MEYYICIDCGMMYTGENELQCGKCERIERLEATNDVLLAKVEQMLDHSKQWVMEFHGDPQNDSNYNYHLGQSVAFTDVKNIINLLHK